MRFGISGKSYEINRDDILKATGGITPKSFDGRNKYYIELRGFRYPIKQAIHLAIGLPYIDFTAQDAKRILERLGFVVHLLPGERETVPVYAAATNATVVDGILKFVITLEQDEDGYIVASVPALPGCHTQGKTEEEVITNIKEAIRGYIASMRRHGEPVPSITEVREVEVAV